MSGKANAMHNTHQVIGIRFWHFRTERIDEGGFGVRQAILSHELTLSPMRIVRTFRHTFGLSHMQMMGLHFATPHKHATNTQCFHRHTK